MARIDEESHAIIGAAMKFVKTGDRSILESYSLDALKKSDYQLNDRDRDSGYRRAIKDLISEFSGEATTIDSSNNSALGHEQEQNRLEKIKLYFVNHKILAPIIIIGIIVISVGSFTDALDKILKFAETRVFKNQITSTGTTSNRPQTIEGDIFEVEAGKSKFFVLPNKEQRYLSVGTIHDVHKYLYVGYEGKRIQLYIGQDITITNDTFSCTVALIEINKTKQSGVFQFKCS